MIISFIYEHIGDGAHITSKQALEVGSYSRDFIFNVIFKGKSQEYEVELNQDHMTGKAWA